MNAAVRKGGRGMKELFVTFLATNLKIVVNCMLDEDEYLISIQYDCATTVRIK